MRGKACLLSTAFNPISVHIQQGEAVNNKASASSNYFYLYMKFESNLCFISHIKPIHWNCYQNSTFIHKFHFACVQNSTDRPDRSCFYFTKLLLLKLLFLQITFFAIHSTSCLLLCLPGDSYTNEREKISATSIGFRQTRRDILSDQLFDVSRKRRVANSFQPNLWKLLLLVPDISAFIKLVLCFTSTSCLFNAFSWFFFSTCISAWCL